MDNTPASAWTKATFGKLAESLPQIIVEAMNEAHGLALKAHLSGEMGQNDTYGHTLKVKMYEVLAEAVRNVPGIVMRKPAGGRFLLPVVQETAVALLPLRYSTDRHETRENSKINLSDLRRSLLALGTSTATDAHQLSIEDALVADSEIDAHFKEMAEIDEQLAAFGRVVTIGFGSNPISGIWGLGWGDLRVTEASDTTFWGSWNALPEVPLAGLGKLSAVELGSAGEEATIFFDQTDDPDELDISPRDPLTESFGGSELERTAGVNSP